MDKRAQGSLEYLLLIGGAVAVAAIVVVLLLGVSSSGGSTSGTNATFLQAKNQAALAGISSGAIAYFNMDSKMPNSAVILGAGGAVTFNVDNSVRGKVTQIQNGSIRIDNVPANTTSGASNTVSMWMKYNEASNWNWSFSWGNNYALYTFNNSSPNLGVSTDIGDIVGAPFTQNTADWFHIVAVYPNAAPTIGNMKLYVNGSQLSPLSTNGTASQARNATSTVYISGNSGTDVRFLENAYVDDVMIFNRELTAAEVQSLYNYQRR